MDDNTFTEEQRKEAKVFAEFYIDLMENYKNTVKYYLSEDVVLDWFGQTVKGEKNVNLFFKNNLGNVKHHFSDAEPANKIGFRESHVVKVPKEPKKPLLTFMSPPRRSEQKTPTKTVQPSTSSTPLHEKGQGDGLHNVCDLPMSPAKRFKPSLALPHPDCSTEIESELPETELENLQVKYMKAEGSVEFHRPSIKKLQTETKWKRPCKLSIAYTSTSAQDCTIYLLIYEGNVKCRRNLLKDFSKEEPEN